MIEAHFVPIDKWPGEPKKSWQRKTGHFRAKYSDTLDLLEKELDHLRAKNIVIEAYFNRNQIRNDGLQRLSCAPIAMPRVNCIPITSKPETSVSSTCCNRPR